MNFLRRFFKRRWNRNSDKNQAEEKIMEFQLLYNKAVYMNTILTDELITGIQDSLEQRYQMVESWDLVYSTYENGFSLKTLLTCLSNKKPPYIFVCQDVNKNIFGAFFATKIEIKNSAFGKLNSFLFKFSESHSTESMENKNCTEQISANCESKVSIYRASGENTYFCLCTIDYLAFGCSDGHFGLLFNSDILSGESYPVTTFYNECLSSKQKFFIERLEVWSVDV
ncbi:TLD domain-containing protein [Hamiltosporidium magnivora]|uniref:TLD domain-containing protein n=1 Tax=Hamiltosporidium magnivora TaxID=148818 RepID=A0A4V2JVT4_9MICR|nr:TLD domain-containing protein [Hamiltosporidium magnivora]